jgi:UDP-N-acetylglucosamine--N-acetylmuramyl-(pentapeptide) pyrophosphoryl-undecaprenol N-acetylglucosamine transferase
VDEIEFAGLPAIYLPYPHHRDQHQRHNASPAVAAGAACCVRDEPDPAKTCERLAAVAHGLLSRGEALNIMQNAASGRSGHHGGVAIAALARELAGIARPA